MFDIAAAPQIPRGLPGAARLDYDRDSPSNFDAAGGDPRAYQQCVKRALTDLTDAGAISHRQRAPLLSSAIRAYHDHHGR